MPKKRKEEYIGSFDISNREVRMILAKIAEDFSSEKIGILHYATANLYPWNDDKQYLGDILEELLSRAEAKMNFKNVEYIGFPVSVELTDAIFKVKEITVTFDGSISVDEQIIQQINQEAIGKFEKMSSEDKIAQDYIVGYKINGEFFPDITGKEVETLNVILSAVYLPEKVINSLSKYLDMLNLNDYTFQYAPISAAYFIPSASKDLGCFQIHGSWQEFDIIYWYKDRVLNLKKLPYGMRMLSKDLEKVFKMSRDVAENLIYNEFGSIREEDISEGVISVTLKSGEKSEISRQFFQRVLEARMDEISELLHSLVNEISEDVLTRYGIKTNLDKIYLTGSFTNLKGVKKLLKRYFENSTLYIPSVEDVKTLIIGEKDIISNVTNLPLFANVINHSANLSKLQNNRKRSDKKKGGFFGVFKRSKRG